ncbi:MAG: M50 family metallopeptidase [Actinomycetota bacterium]
MSFALGILAFVATLMIMVVFHEFGHFITARRFGIKVEQFFVGFGPRLFSWTRGETEYGVKAVLLGGYVRIAGMNPFQEVKPSELPRTFGAKPAWQRAVVLVAGSATHLILATVVFALLFSTLGVYNFDRPVPTVETVEIQVNGKPGPAKAAGLRRGDRIVAVSGDAVRSWDDVRKVIRSSPNKQLVFTVEREGRRRQLTITPAEAEVRSSPDSTRMVKAGQIGIAPQFEIERDPPHVALWRGVTSTAGLVKVSIESIGKVFSPGGISNIFEALGRRGEREVSDDEPLGLVGGARLAGQAGSAGEVRSLIQFLAGFIVFVGVINLAPLPPLDGGYLLIVGIEKLIRRKIDMRKVIPVAGLVLAFLIVLTFALLYLDIFRPITDPFQ